MIASQIQIFACKKRNSLSQTDMVLLLPQRLRLRNDMLKLTCSLMKNVLAYHRLIWFLHLRLPEALRLQAANLKLTCSLMKNALAYRKVCGEFNATSLSIRFGSIFQNRK